MLLFNVALELSSFTALPLLFVGLLSATQELFFVGESLYPSIKGLEKRTDLSNSRLPKGLIFVDILGALAGQMVPLKGSKLIFAS